MEELQLFAFSSFSPISAMDANGGEVLEGLREFGLCFGFRTYEFASHAFALVAYSCMVEFIEETPSLVIYAMKFKFITRA